MLPIIAIPEIVNRYAPHFKEIFSEAEFEHFKRYLSGLIVSENKTVEAINRLFVIEVKHQSSLNRFLTASSYKVEDVNQKRLDLMNAQTQTALKGKASNCGVLALDDTFLTHYGKHFEQIAKLYDHSTQTYVWAHNLVNLHYSDDQTDYPINFEIWKPANMEELEAGLRKAEVKIKVKKEPLKTQAPDKWRNYLIHLYRKNQKLQVVQEAYRSKVIIGQDLLRRFFGKYPDLDIPVSFDKWFTSPSFCKFMDQDLKKAYVAGLQSDEQVLQTGSKKIKVGDFTEKLKAEHLSGQNSKPIFQKTTISYKGKNEVFYNYCKVHHICGYGRQMLLISHQQEDLSDAARVFIGNRLNWRVQHMTKVGRHRWPIEEYHKEGKAEGLNQYQLRDIQAIEKHIAMVAVVYSILQYAQFDTEFLNTLKSQLDTNIEGSLAFWRRSTQAQGLWLMVQWIDSVLQKGWPLEKIMKTLLPAYNLG